MVLIQRDVLNPIILKEEEIRESQGKRKLIQLLVELSNHLHKNIKILSGGLLDSLRELKIGVDPIVSKLQNNAIGSDKAKEEFAKIYAKVQAEIAEPAKELGNNWGL